MFLVATLLLILLHLSSASSDRGSYSIQDVDTLLYHNQPEISNRAFPKDRPTFVKLNNAICSHYIASECLINPKSCPLISKTTSHTKNCHVLQSIHEIRGGSNFMPSGWNPFGYKITKLGEDFLKYEGSLESDVGRFLKSLVNVRKTKATIKGSWLEVVRVAKTGQSMRIYRQLDALLQFCLSAGFID